MTTWNIRLFAYLRVKHGDVATVQAEPSTAKVLSALEAQGIDVKPCRLAVNLVFAQGDQPLNPGDELALIPPVSGG